MKNTKLNYLQIFILLFTVSITTISCSTDNNETLPEESQIKSLNTLENRKLISDLFTKGTNLNKQLINSEEFRKYYKNSDVEINADESLLEYEQCSECPLEYKNFLIPFFEEVKDLTNVIEISSKIEEYEFFLGQSNLTHVTKENLKFTLFSFKEASLYIAENPNFEERINSKSGGCGRALGQGLVSGFVAGCIRGGIAGAVGGTVTVPVIGTVTGAVGGCIANGAVTGVISGFAAWGWCALK